jgi:hypothetical protein
MSESTRAQLQQIYQLIKTGQNEEAVETLRSILTIDPNNVDAWWLMANAARDPVEQRSAVDRVLLLRPDHKQAQEKLNALKAAEEFRFDEPEKPKRDFASGAPPVIVQPQKSGTNPLVIILAIVGGLALVICGVCFVISIQGATLFGSAMATLAESVTGLPGMFNDFEDDIADINSLKQQGSITVGNPVTGQISTPFGYNGYSFNGEKGQNITITVSTSDSDFLPRVAIYDSSGELLDSAGGLDFESSSSSLDEVSFSERLPSSGNYTIVVGSWVSTGNYTLEVE